MENENKISDQPTEFKVGDTVAYNFKRYGRIASIDGIAFIETDDKDVTVGVPLTELQLVSDKVLSVNLEDSSVLSLEDKERIEMRLEYTSKNLMHGRTGGIDWYDQDVKVLMNEIDRLNQTINDTKDILKQD